MVYADRQGEVVDPQQQREAVDGEQREAVFTAQQREIIKTKVDAYYDVHHEARGLTWAGLCDEIFDYTQVQVRHEDLRQWVDGFIPKNRKQPRRPNKEELKAIVSFLIHADIHMLSEEELNEPEIPFGFAAFLLDFLAHPGHKQTFPPLALSGTYVAFGRAEDGRRRPKALLGLEVREGDHVIRVWEETWTDDGDPLKVFRIKSRANGWAVITPEDNLFIFRKDKRSGINHYYFTLASYPSLWSDTSLRQFGLLRHGHPVPDDCTNKYLDELMDDTEDETVLLHFNKIT